MWFDLENKTFIAAEIIDPSPYFWLIPNKMGKKKIEKIERIQNANQRKVCLCKRKKGLIKKAIELSVLCDLEIFMLVYDKSHWRITHYGSHEDFDIMNMFNSQLQREYFSNFDFGRVGGAINEIDSKYVRVTGTADIEEFSETEDAGAEA